MVEARRATMTARIGNCMAWNYEWRFKELKAFWRKKSW
jgi:hypothetical protein